MSVATPFRFKQPLPWCPGDISGSTSGYDYVDNLTLTQVMAFYWNLETFRFDFSGSATTNFPGGSLTINGTQNVVFGPMSSSWYDRGNGGGAWFPSVASNTVFGSWPAISAPRDRVCNETGSFSQIQGFSLNRSAAPGQNFANLFILLGTDPVNSGRYRIYYLMAFVFDASSGAPHFFFIEITWGNPSAGIGANTPLASGTFTIGGITFGYQSSYGGNGTSSSATGGSMSASSSSFTYP